MDRIQKAWTGFKELIVCHILLAVTFLTTGIVVDLIQGLLYITIRPYSPSLYRKINYYVTYTLNSQIVFIVEWWSNSRVKLYTDPENVKKYLGKEHAYLLLNHCYEVDWLMGWVVCDRSRVLGNAKVYVKKVLQYAPVLGWSWKFQEIVFLERNWEKDKKFLGTQLNRLVDYPYPFWLTLFPEGTRFTPEKHQASMKVAREKGLPELKHHLLPRTRGFVASIPYLKKKVPAIYDITVAFKPKQPYEPTVVNILRGKPLECFMYFKRIPMEEVPDDEKEAADWLHKLYQEKDKILDNFKRTGSFNGNGEFPEYNHYENIEMPRRFYSLLNILTWGCFILFPLVYYLSAMLTSGSYLQCGLALFFMFLAYIGMYKLINLTKISTSSSEYGSVK